MIRDLGKEEFLSDKGYFDVAFECTGASSVLRSVIPVVKPRGTIVQVGVRRREMSLFRLMGWWEKRFLWLVRTAVIQNFLWLCV